MKYQLGTIS